MEAARTAAVLLAACLTACGASPAATSTTAFECSDPRTDCTGSRQPDVLRSELARLRAQLAHQQLGSPEATSTLVEIADDDAELALALDLRGEAAAFQAHLDAIDAYERVRAQPGGATDHVLYSTGLEYERVGDPHSARSAYLDLVAQHASSPLVPYAYFAFGEIASDDARSDPAQLELARRSYEESRVRLPPGDPLTPYVARRLSDLRSGAPAH